MIPTFLRDLGIRIRALNCAPISAGEYAEHYHAWGGSFILHPEVLRFFEESHCIRTDYRGYFKNGICIGAVATWGPFIAGERDALRAHGLTDRVDFGYPVLYLPAASDQRYTVLFRARFLLSLQRRQIAGAFFPRKKAMSILKQIPEALPTGKKEFQMKERRFLSKGGVIRDVREFSGDEIVAMYRELFRGRWKRDPHAIGGMRDALASLHKFLYGKVLWANDRAIAIQINYRAETSRTLCVDYINGGVDKSFHNISPGSLLSFINGREACAEARTKGKLLIYSYGKSDADYKDQWCDRVGRGYAGFWMP